MIAILRDALKREEIEPCIAPGDEHDDACRCCQMHRAIAIDALRAFDAAPGLEKDKELRGKLYAHLGSDRDTSKVLAIVTAHLRGAAK